GTGYQYAHDFENGIAAQDYLGVEKTYYHPTDRGFEKELQARLERIRAVLKSAKSEATDPAPEKPRKATRRAARPSSDNVDPSP
ncbi:MAG: replication-associated recombination protein A, partial [Thermogutta sp.]|nr:replication-associated recombination protein A [Thermogutta sp.]